MAEQQSQLPQFPPGPLPGSQWPGRTRIRQAINCICSFVVERGLEGDLNFSVATRKTSDSLTITIYHGDGVMNFIVTEEELQQERDAQAQRQHDNLARPQQRHANRKRDPQ